LGKQCRKALGPCAYWPLKVHHAGSPDTLSATCRLADQPHNSPSHNLLKDGRPQYKKAPPKQTERRSAQSLPQNCHKGAAPYKGHRALAVPYRARKGPLAQHGMTWPNYCDSTHNTKTVKPSTRAGCIRLRHGAGRPKAAGWVSAQGHIPAN
jgi:hypothetical protein